MKTKLLFILSTFLMLSCSTPSPLPGNSNTASAWSDAKSLEHLENRQDSATWDLELLETDKQMAGYSFGPFQLGAFPVPDYDILGKGSFTGIGYKNEEFSLNNRTLLMNSFFVAENELNKDRLKGRKDEVFFQIIVLTDTVDTENYALDQRVVISRNHPDYLGQGFVGTKELRIDYLAFQTAGNDAYAIVNTRLFNLKYGKTILIAPQKDKTLRSLQINSPQLTSESLIPYTRELIRQDEIINFFEREANI